MGKKSFLLATIVLFISATATWAATFKGKVIDADTKQPIEGAVVVAAWYEAGATVAGPTSRLKDVKESLTDKRGEWVIEGPKGRELGFFTSIFTFVTGIYITNPPNFIVFKPGYCSWPEGFMIDACKGTIRPEGNHRVAAGEMVELSILNNREDRLRAQRIGPIFNGKELINKQPNFIRLLNEEKRKLGIPEI